MNTTLPALLCATSYDATTEFLKEILEKYSHQGSRFINLKGNQITYDKLVNQTLNNKEIIFIFGGHGSSKALHVRGDYQDVKSILYSKEYFTLGPQILIAFTCLAGKELGENFEESTQGYFFGFTSKISFISKEEYKIHWKNIFHEIINEIRNNGVVNQDVISKAEEKYKSIIKMFESGTQSNLEHARMMRMLLREQLKGIYKTQKI